MRRALWLAVLLATFAAGAAYADVRSRSLTVGVNGKMDATLYTPDGPGPFPSVIVIHTSEGLTQVDQAYCRALALEGFQCIVPAFLRAYGIRLADRERAQTSDREALLADFRQIVDMMNGLPNARPGAVGTVGFSNGGFFSMLLAAQQKTKAGVCYYGALIGVAQPLPANPFLQSFSAASSPVLYMIGTNDTGLGVAPIRMAEAIMNRVGAPHEVVVYPDAEHGFDRNNLRPGNEAAKKDAWLRTLVFLRRYLR